MRRTHICKGKDFKAALRPIRLQAKSSRQHKSATPVQICPDSPVRACIHEAQPRSGLSPTLLTAFGRAFTMLLHESARVPNTEARAGLSQAKQYIYIYIYPRAHRNPTSWSPHHIVREKTASEAPALDLELQDTHVMKN